MSVLIKGMKMPKNCDDCPFEDFGGCMFRVQREDCPFVKAPTYGRLIDGDMLESLIYERLSDIDYKADAFDILRIVQDMPTIIEAEEGADHE